jgi:hypothetical protein
MQLWYDAADVVSWEVVSWEAVAEANFDVLIQLVW